MEGMSDMPTKEAPEAGKNFASFFKSCGVWGQLRPGGTLPSGRPSRQARLAPHGLPTGAAGEKSSQAPSTLAAISIPGSAFKASANPL